MTTVAEPNPGAPIAKKTDDVEVMIKAQAAELGQNAAYYKSDNMMKPMKLELDADDAEAELAAKNSASAAKRMKKRDEIDLENIYVEDTGRVDMIGNLTSSRLLEISERFDLYPSGQVDCE
jgi:hypothetical protein